MVYENLWRLGKKKKNVFLGKHKKYSLEINSILRLVGQTEETQWGKEGRKGKGRRQNNWLE